MNKDLNKETVNRRAFLRISGGAAAAVSGVGASLTPKQSWAAGLSTLDSAEANRLLSVARVIFPHDNMADDYYMALINVLDEDAKANADTAKMMKDGLASLDAATGVKWENLSAGGQLNVLKSMQETPFFQAVRGKGVVALYNDDLSWRHFGYEGSSFEKGGYIERGFNDLNWLETPTVEASPPKA